MSSGNPGRSELAHGQTAKPQAEVLEASTARAEDSARDTSMPVSVLSLIPDPVMRLSPAGQVLHANRAALAYLGVQHEHVAGRMIDELGLEPAVVEFWRSALASVRDSQVEHVFEQHVGQPPEERLFRVRVIPELASNELRALVVIGRDVTHLRDVDAASLPGRRSSGATGEHRLTTESLSSVVGGFFAVDLNFRCQFVNERGARLLRRHENQLPGVNVFDAWPEARGTRFATELIRVLQHHVGAHFELDCPHVGATLEFRLCPTADGVFVFFSDTSERKQVHQALAESEAKFRAVFEQAAVGIARVGLDGRFREVNDRFAAITGYTPEELVERSFQEITWPEDLSKDLELARQLERGALSTYSIEKRYIRKDGNVIWVNLTRSVMSNSAGVPSLITVIEDITQRKRTEEALHTQNAVLSGIARILREALTSTTEEALLASCIQIGMQITGSTIGCFQSRERDEVHVVSRSTNTVDGEAHFTQRTVPPSMLTVEHTTQHELLRWLATLTDASNGRTFIAVPIQHGNQLAGMLGFGGRRDGYGTDHLEAAMALAPAIARAVLSTRSEAELKRANERLAESARRKNDFIGVLSHELRNPLAPISNSLYILKHSGTDFERAHRAHAVLERQIGQLARLVDDLLDVTRIGKNKIQLRREPLDLAKLLRGTVDDHRASFELSGIALEFIAPEEPLVVDGDPNRLAQIVGNLLQNAVKFTERGGCTRLELFEENEGIFATIRIRDTGMGMPAEVLSHLFEPFVQADMTLERTRSGLGLGLALVKGLVELHGGTIEASSEGPGRGSEFVVRLPIVPEKLRRRDDNTECKNPGTVRRILVVEDNVDAAQSLRELLELLGHEVEVRHSGPQGVAAARTFQPHLVLCDIGLPGMDGYEVARAIRSEPTLSRLHLVALSGYARPQDLTMAIGAGFDRHLSKPPCVEAILEILAML
ncbi:MAG: PAS domain S-box protein [Polyangiaceae bacterium]